MTKRRIALAGIRFVDIDESLFARSVIFFIEIEINQPSVNSIMLP